jgi:hypothetical protein
MLVLLGCIIASLFIALNAGGAESKANAATAAAAAEKAPAKPAPAKPDVAVPPKAEDAATIEDDPTIAPDPKESADNDITFPVDI